jgi:ubiquinone/menaquinone biosynthesis C-methylase UbiE
MSGPGAGGSFKEFEHAGWKDAAVPYDAAFSRLTRLMVPDLLDVLQVGPGTRFLDVACGPGYLAAAARERGAEAVGVDFSASMVERARQLFPDVAFREGDAETLAGLADASFDAVGINFGVLHFGDPAAALRAAHRVLRPGGRAAFTAWRPPGEAQAFAVVQGAIEKFGSPDVRVPDGPPFFQFGGPAACADLLARCGFGQHATRILPRTWELNSADELFDAFLHGTARTGGLLRRQPAEHRERIRDAVRCEAGRFAQGGELRFPMPALLAWGVKPAPATA